LINFEECGLIVNDSAAVAVVSKKLDLEMILIATEGPSQRVMCCC